MPEQIEGTIEQILFFNPENGYSVLKFSIEGGETKIIVGHFPPLSPGERLTVTGEWENNPKFGPQFKVDHFVPVLPSSAKGIEKFLSCGLIKGIGPVLAKRIVKAFGERTLDILSHKPDRMKEVEGVGAVKLGEIKRSWEEHQDIRDLIIFLQQHNVSTSLATKIYRHYGQKSYHVLKANPYQLCLDIWGIGFKTADQIALKLGMDPASLERARAFLLYLLEKDNEQGHVFSYESELIARCRDEIGADEDKVREALESLKTKKYVVAEPLAADTAVYRPFFFHAQEEVVRSIQTLARASFVQPPFDVDQVVAEVEKELKLEFSELQKTAIRESFQKKILVITGGPGTGKTTIVKAVTAVFDKWGRKVLLAAPTGRAAKRLAETTGKEAKTIHRTLEFNPKLNSFRRTEHHPLAGDAIIIDEFSMVDLSLMYALIKAIPPSMRLIVVGDKDQLPALGPGTLLRDLIESGQVSVVRLDQIFRQERDSLIVSNAHRINQGQSIIYPPRGDKSSDFYFLHQEDPQKVFKMILDLCGYSIPKKLGLPPISPEIQVISPMYKGIVGVDRLNVELQKRLNGSSDGIWVGSREIRLRDKVMQVRNDYEKDVFNGDIGTVVHIDKSRYRVIVHFDGRPVFYEKDDLDDITLAYAVSVHKAQGSEYQAVVMPLLTQHFIMLQRNLFYTALTRAKKLSIIIGSYKALYIAIKNDKPIKRNSRIKEKLLEAGAAFDLR
ncbi:MAG: ATP-dependent RecD-like DNA helicase [Candidatus Aminicenantes bacterium]|nr:ATP-dependent RecD-like DNA helicase [Candidatus Aminicenantes bacterium]